MIPIRFNPEVKYDIVQLRAIAVDLKQMAASLELDVKVYESCKLIHCKFCDKRAAGMKITLNQVKEELMLVGRQL